MSWSQLPLSPKVISKAEVIDPVDYHYGMNLYIERVIFLTDTSDKAGVVPVTLVYEDSQGNVQSIEFSQLAVSEVGASIGSRWSWIEARSAFVSLVVAPKLSKLAQRTHASWRPDYCDLIPLFDLSQARLLAPIVRKLNVPRQSLIA